MKRSIKPGKFLTSQVKAEIMKPIKKKKVGYDGNIEVMVDTGSTLLNLAISGTRKRGGGIPAGILVELFGPSGSGKTVMLCEIAGACQRTGGEAKFHDPEARLNTLFASIFGAKITKNNYDRPDTVTQVFKAVRKWDPPVKKGAINVIATDSLAALSTNLEMGKEEGDKMGTRRAKEFSEELRKTARILAKKDILMVCSNQIRQNIDAGPFGQKYTTPGGHAMEFYASLRIKFMFAAKLRKIIETIKIKGKEVKRVVGVNVVLEIVKSSIDKPYRTAPVTIIFDYGIDDIRQNLQYIKDYKKLTTYCVGKKSMDSSLEKAIRKVEDLDLTNSLREEVIDLWQIIESKFESNRKPKKR